ncbi:DUF6710 family protein [Limosilactobacillus walteri]|uniref:Uncharacterized protein n=1 Tax=Limosilactobacillus walteri TaxID=2268022 RepID=A0ABR8P9J2_9LACO|nr:DUF6710 family protein [Limosilactobacillus walteri]MBD5807444.1 hypothetical protein [Limosilactobacillus walteri]
MLKIFSIFNSKNNKKAVGNAEKLRKSINYLTNQKDSGDHLIDKFHTLMYLQKIICNSITYDDYGYKTIYEPNSAPELGLKDFLPRNNLYKNIDMHDNPILINSKDVAFITMPWSNERIIDSLRGIGNDADNRFDNTNSNIDNLYIYPLGIVLVSSGNHSQLSGLLKCELKRIKVTGIYDISEELLKDKDGQFVNFLGSSEENTLLEKWQSLMEIGKYLLKYNEFPHQIVNCIEKENDKKDREGNKVLNSMTYKDKVLTEFSNTAYRRLTGAMNFDNVPKAIWNLWYDENNEYSVQSLSKANADDSKWKTLYGMFQREFAKLK